MEKKYYYKAMDKDMKCRSFQFKVGETYTIESEEELELCSDSVFHFCKKLEDTIDYYNNSSDRHFLIETLGDIITAGDKSGSNKIRIVREISRDEIEEHIQVETTGNAKEFLALYTTNVKMLEILYKDKNEVVRWAVASNPNTPVYILKKLAKDEDEDVRRAVAKNPNTLVKILEKLAKDKEWEVRSAVAENPNTSKRMLKKMAKDEDLDVRSSVIENPNTPVYLLEELAKDVNWEVRWTVVLNKNIPIYLLEELSKDEDVDVRKKAQKRLKEITQ